MFLSLTENFSKIRVFDIDLNSFTLLNSYCSFFVFVLQCRASEPYGTEEDDNQALTLVNRIHSSLIGIFHRIY